MPRITTSIAALAAASALVAGCAPAGTSAETHTNTANTKLAAATPTPVPAINLDDITPVGSPPDTSNWNGWLGWWEKPSAALLSGPTPKDIYMLWLRPCGNGKVCTIDAGDSNNNGNWGESLPVPANSNQVLTSRKRDLNQAGHRVWLTLIDDTPQATQSIQKDIKKPKLRKRLARQLVNAAKLTGTHGVDLDIESLVFNTPQDEWRSYRGPYTRLVQDVQRMAKKAGKQVSVTVPVGVGAGTDGGYVTYNWKRLGRLANRVNLMTYDYSTNGPIAPLDWVSTTIADAKRQIPARKIFIGATTVGNSTSTDYSSCPDTFTADPGWQRTRPTWSQAQNIINREAQNGHPTVWDSQAGEWNLTYFYNVPGTNQDGSDNTCTVPRTLHTLGAAGITARSDLADRSNIAGLAIWGLNASPQM